MARLLLVEDDPSLARAIAATLELSGFTVDRADEGNLALEMIAAEPFALVILDVGLPDMSGFDVLSEIRLSGNRVPVLILTARDAVDDRIFGLNAGADDYLLKPFQSGELEARLHALLRRTYGVASSIIQVGSLVIDQVRATTHVNGRLVELRPRERTLLERLIAHLGEVVHKDRLTSEIYGYDDPVGPNALEVHIARLRKKLEPDGPTIRTVRGLGYALDPPGI